LGEQHVVKSFGHWIVVIAVSLLAASYCPADSATTAPTSVPSAPSAPSAAPATARSVIESVVHDVLGILRDPNLTKPDKFGKIRAIADQQTDFPTLARLSLGQYWRSLSDSQKAQYVKEFEGYMSSTHAHVFDQYVDEDVIINGDHAEQRGDYTVQSTIVENQSEAGRKKEVAKVDYRLRQQDGRWKIIDVNIDGVSMAMNFRSQFQDIMANGGFDRLIKLLREKNGSGSGKQ
jgi:phospholipid transport system substrate-binding protein